MSRWGLSHACLSLSQGPKTDLGPETVGIATILIAVSFVSRFRGFFSI